jgi:hypothetical protein
MLKIAMLTTIDKKFDNVNVLKTEKNCLVVLLYSAPDTLRQSIYLDMTTTQSYQYSMYCVTSTDDPLSTYAINTTLVCSETLKNFRPSRFWLYRTHKHFLLSPNLLAHLCF